MPAHIPTTFPIGVPRYAVAAIRPILVVDDEEIARKLVVRWLQQSGFKAVSSCATADEAITAMTEKPAEVIIVALCLLGHGGLWLMEQVRDRWPSTRIIVASRAQGSETVAQVEDFGAVALLPKPYSQEMMRDALVRAFTKLGVRSNQGAQSGSGKPLRP